MNQKFTSTIAGASIFISVLGLISRGLGFFREIIFANNFGLENNFDLYLVGAVIPITINNIVLFIGQNFFIPGFQKINSLDTVASEKYFRKSFIIFFTVGILIAILIFLSSDFIINYYMQSASILNKQIASQILKIFLLTIPFSAGISILSALLQTVYEFKYPAISILFLNLSIIIFLLLFTDKFGIYIIPVGYTVGTLLQFVYLIIKSRKFVTLKLIERKSDFKLTKSFLGSSLLIIVLIESISQLYSLFDRYFYTEVSTGGIASLNYGLMVWFLPISIFSISLATAVFPVMNRAINESVFDDIEKIYNESISMNTFIFLPVAFILFFYGDSLIRVMFERGRFVEESTSMTFGVLRFYSISLVFYSVYTVFNKLFYSLNQIKLLLWITIAGLILKMVFNFMLIGLEQDGLALSTSISFIFFFLISYVLLNRKLKIKNRSVFAKDFILLFFNCTISLITINIITSIINFNGFLRDGILIIIFIIIYTISSILTGHNSVVISGRVLRNLNLGNKSIVE